MLLHLGLYYNWDNNPSVAPLKSCDPKILHPPHGDKSLKDAQNKSSALLVR